MVSIRYKAVMPVGIVATMLALLAALAATALTELGQINQSLAQRFVEIEEVREIEVDVSHLTYPLVTHFTHPHPVLAEKAAEILGRIDERMDELREMAVVNPEERQLLDFVSEQMLQIDALTRAYFAMGVADRVHMSEALHELSGVYLPALSDRLHTWHTSEAAQVAELAEAGEAHRRHFEIAAAAIVALALAVLLFALWLNNRVLVRPVLTISGSTAALAAGDLHQHIDLSSNDELGRLAGDINRMAQSLEVSYQRLEQLANSDALTGLMNRRAFETIAKRELDAAKRYGRRLSLVMFDIDHFKKINDTYGHAAGDAVLKWVAERVQATLRSSDGCYRFGGEEFVLVLQEADGDGGWRIAERCRAILAAEPCVLNGQAILVTASFGLTCCPDEGVELAQLLERADTALYQAKHLGRNRVERYMPAQEVVV